MMFFSAIFNILTNDDDDDVIDNEFLSIVFTRVSEWRGGW